MTVPTVPNRPLTVPMGAVTATVPTVPSPPIGGTVAGGDSGAVAPVVTAPIAAIWRPTLIASAGAVRRHMRLAIR
ncbi:hypothetical protein P3T35_003029 [Kitasatospora sp. GP30]|nr:hypothetical protein [Kitasatospora sp. GP30]